MDNKDLISQIVDIFEEQAKQIDAKLEAQTKRIEVKIENDVTKKIEALFDGYKLTHEKQWELERRMDSLEKLVEKLQDQIA